MHEREREREAIDHIIPAFLGAPFNLITSPNRPLITKRSVMCVCLGAFETLEEQAAANIWSGTYADEERMN